MIETLVQPTKHSTKKKGLHFHEVRPNARFFHKDYGLCFKLPQLEDVTCSQVNYLKILATAVQIVAGNDGNLIFLSDHTEVSGDPCNGIMSKMAAEFVTLKFPGQKFFSRIRIIGGYHRYTGGKIGSVIEFYGFGMDGRLL